MIEDLRKYHYLGSPNTFLFLFQNILDHKTVCWKENELNQVFLNKYIDGQFIFDGCIKFALEINVLAINEGCIYLDSSIEKNIEHYEKFVDCFNKFIFESLKNDPIFIEIFKSENLTYDMINKGIQINNSSFGLRYSNFKQLLINFNILQKHPESQFKSFIINARYKYLFDKTILPEIRRNEVSIEEFQKSMELKQKYGLEAEQFVLDFENKRLNKKKDINWVAEYIVNAGYDIASYNSEEDTFLNRFIEVKSFEGDKPYFFWSRNELKESKIRKKQYWLYLVNRNKMNDNDYHPTIINNPCEEILKNDDWRKSIENYKVSYIGAANSKSNEL